ncbi:hypothetical protein [Actinosynnema sp. NPDC023587]|uniref:hypothetical protein n=1 Tax=Actinosynnema sp. NPDC023587 TaxID=3154695 RepID=UPI0033DF92F6
MTGTFRAMAGRSGRISHTTSHECVSGSRLPSWETTREFVRSCGEGEAEWQERLPLGGVAALRAPESCVTTAFTTCMVK